MTYSDLDDSPVTARENRFPAWVMSGLRRTRSLMNDATSISDDAWSWIGAIAGLVFVLAFLLSRLMIPGPPAIDSDVSVVMTYFSAYAGTLITAGVIETSGAIVFLIFLGVVHNRQVRANGGVSGSVLLAVGTVFAAVGAVSAIITTTLAILANQSGGLPTDSYVSAAYVLSTVLGTGVFGLVAAVMLIVFGIALLAKRPLGGWIGLLVVALGLVNAAGGGAALVMGSYTTAWMVVQTVGVFGVALAVLAVSLNLLPEGILAGAVVRELEGTGVAANLLRRLGVARVPSYGRVLSGVALFGVLALAASIAVPLTTRGSDTSLLAAAGPTTGIAATGGNSSSPSSSSSASVGYDGAASCAPTTDAQTSGGSPQVLESRATQVASGTIEGKSWSLWSEKGQTGAAAIEDGGLVFNGREYGLCAGYPNPSETEMISTGSNAIIYGVVNYPGLAQVQLGTGGQGFTMESTLPSPHARVVNGVSFYIGTLPKSACDYSYLVIDTTSGSYTSQHNIGFGTNGAGEGYSISNNPGNVGACLPGKLDPLSFSQGQWSARPPTTSQLP